MIRINNTQYFHFLEQADELRRSGSLCDAIISVQRQTFKAHRLVLACASRRLAQHLSCGDADSPARCTLELLSSKTFQQVLDFTYTQALDVPVEDLHLLLKAAQELEMQPLEDQCRKQLETLDSSAKEEKSRGGVTVLEEIDKKSKLLSHVHVSTNTAHGREALVDLTEDHSSTSLERKRLRCSSVSETPDSQDRKVSWPVSSHSALSSLWAFPANIWRPVNTLRQLAQNYSSLMTAQSLQSSPLSLMYPISLYAPHTLPQPATSSPSPAHGRVAGQSSSHHHYPQSLHMGPLLPKSIFKHGPLERGKLCHRPDEPRYAEVQKNSTEAVKDGKPCDKSLFSDHLLHEETSVMSDDACSPRSFCRRDSVMQFRYHDNKGKKNYQCQHCPKKFNLKHQLDTHHRVHTGEKPFECRLCGQRSRDYSAMIKHLRTHGGAAPYQCTVCLEFCSSLVAMQRHIKSHAAQDFPPDWSINSTYLYNSHL